MRYALASLSALALLLTATHARALGTFPDEIVKHLKITCTNPKWDGQGCMVCHQDDNGGCTRATRPFGVWLKSQGLSCSNLDPSLLDRLLDEAKDSGIDTNCDGVADVDELTSCEWPKLMAANTCDAGDAGAGDGGVLPPAQTENVIYGCSASSTSPVAPTSAAVVLSSVLVALTVRRQRARPSSAA